MKMQWKKGVRLVACGVTGALTLLTMTTPVSAAQVYILNGKSSNAGICTEYQVSPPQDCSPLYGGQRSGGTVSGYSLPDLLGQMQNGSLDINKLYEAICPGSPATSCPEWDCPEESKPQVPAPEAPCPVPSNPTPSNPEPSNPAPTNPVPSNPKPTNPDNGNSTKPGDTSIQMLEQQMVALINEEREAAGVEPLAINDKLTGVARAKSQDMIDNSYFSHTSPTYGSPFEMMKSFGISYKTAGENIAMNMSVEGAHQGLMNSEGHRNNILNPSFTSIGLGIAVNSSGYLYITQMFIG